MNNFDIKYSPEHCQATFEDDDVTSPGPICLQIPTIHEVIYGK